MDIKILGTGCKNCDALEINVKKALFSENIEGNVLKVSDIPSIAKYGVMRTPALVINEKVLSYGKVLSKEEVIELLKKIPN